MNAPTFVLGIETATPACSVALATIDGSLIAQSWRESIRPASSLLLNDIDRLLKEVGANHASLVAIAVTLGPGAFTGLRVGLAIAKSLAVGLSIPLYGFSTLAMLARRWPVRGFVATLLDARRSEVYAGLYRVENPLDHSPISCMSDNVAPIDRVIEQMKLILQGEPVVLLGGGVLKYRDALSMAFAHQAIWGPATLLLPAAEAAALAGAEALRSGASPLDPLEALPRYLRASDAVLRHPGGIDLSAALSL